MHAGGDVDGDHGPFALIDQFHDRAVSAAHLATEPRTEDGVHDDIGLRQRLPGEGEIIIEDLREGDACSLDHLVVEPHGFVEFFY